MTTSNFDVFDHRSHMREALELAGAAAARGDELFESVLIRDDSVIMAESTRKKSDIRRHPELHLAYREFDAGERAAMVMYTGTEPCQMCAGGIAIAGFGRVVYSVGRDEIAAFSRERASSPFRRHPGCGQ